MEGWGMMVLFPCFPTCLYYTPSTSPCRSLCFKGAPDGSAILCSPSRTYAIRTVGTTNSVFLGTDPLTEPGKSVDKDVDENAGSNGIADKAAPPPFEALATAASHLELVPLAPARDGLERLLRQTEIRFASEATDETEAEAMDADGTGEPGERGVDCTGPGDALDGAFRYPSSTPPVARASASPSAVAHASASSARRLPQSPPPTSWCRLMSTVGCSPLELARALAALGAVPLPARGDTAPAPISSAARCPEAAGGSASFSTVFRRPSRALLLETLELASLTCQGEGLDPRDASVDALVAGAREVGHSDALARGCLALLGGSGLRVREASGSPGGDATKGGGRASSEGKGSDEGADDGGKGGGAVYFWPDRREDPDVFPSSSFPPLSPSFSAPVPPSTMHAHAHFPPAPLLALPARVDLGGAAVRLLLADAMLDERSEWPCRDFLQTWCQRVDRIAPGGPAPTIEELRGRAIAVVPRKGPPKGANASNYDGLETAMEASRENGSRTAFPMARIPQTALLVRLRSEELPSDARARFQALFRAKTLWLADDLAPYVADAAAPGQTLEALLLRHARAVQPDLSKPPMYGLRR